MFKLNISEDVCCVRKIVRKCHEVSGSHPLYEELIDSYKQGRNS